MGDRSGHFLHSKEGVTQGEPLTMIAHVIGVLPLIRELRGAHPQVTQPCYADDAVAGGKFHQIFEHFWDLQAQGPAQFYYPEPTKSILVVIPVNLARSEEHFRGLEIWLVTGHWYLGGYIGNREAEGSWLEAKRKGWTESVAILAGVAQNHPPFCLRVTTEVTPTGVGICAAGDPERQ